MKLQIMSDLHLEFHHDRGQAFISRLDSSSVDVLVLAGDICTYSQIPGVFSAFCEKYPAVIFTYGNHEFYRSGFRSVRQAFSEIAARFNNLYILDNSIAKINGQRFVGTSLWFSEQEDSPAFEKHLNDFSCIEDFRDLVYKENMLATQFLEENLSPDDIVVTHHLPSMVDVPPEYQQHPLVRFFVCEMDHLILKQRPALWIHGHTHRSCDYLIGETHLLCNPYGYFDHELNKDFSPQLYIDLP